MSHLRYYAYPGFGVALREKTSYSQAVRVGDRIEISGQGGWDTTTGEISKDLAEEINQAFKNVDLTLRDAGGKGWSQVYKVTVYTTEEITEPVMALLVGNMRRWMPDHQPILTGIGVAGLGIPGMRIEIEVVAHDPEGAAAAATEK